MSAEEIKEIVKTLEAKPSLKAYEQRFLNVYNKKTCDEDLIRELRQIGRDKYIERNYKAEFNKSNRNFISDIKNQGQSLKGKWNEPPPPPPAIPSDCCIM